MLNRRSFLATASAAPSLHAQTRFALGASMLAGFAEADITPEIGMEQPGGYGKVFHRSVHDPCKARVAVFDDGRKAVALVGLDALIVPRALVLAARKRIQAQCGIPGDAVLINASHSHSSGPTGLVQPGEFDSSPELVRRLAYEKSSMADARYLKIVEDQIVAAVCRAHKERADRQCGVGLGHEDKAAYNRRFRMKNGRTFTHPGQGNPDIVKVAGPIDPQVGVIGAWDRAGWLAGCIVNYADHATASPGGISANWIYYMERAIRGMFGQQAVVVFIQGACGDVTQVDNLSPHLRPSGREDAEFVGGRVGAEATKVLLGMPRGSLAPVEARSRVLKIERRVPSREKVAEANRLVQMDPQKAGVTEWTFAKETLMLADLIRREPVADVEVQAIQVGPAVFVSNPAEYFVEFGLEIKAKSRFQFTFPAELSNGCVGYVPTEEALSESGGGYETRLTFYSNLVPDAGRHIAAEGIALTHQLTPGALPEPPRAKPFGGTPWTYGNVPAERK